jgi:hypothetical protein
MKRKESHTQFFKSVKSVMAFSAYYTSLIDIANNCKFLDVKDPPLTVIDFVYLAKIVDIGLYLPKTMTNTDMFTNIFKELKDDEDILFSGATTVGNLFASSKVDKTKDPKKKKNSKTEQLIK